jgi:hypothetical protein
MEGPGEDVAPGVRSSLSEHAATATTIVIAIKTVNNLRPVITKKNSDFAGTC